MKMFWCWRRSEQQSSQEVINILLASLYSPAAWAKCDVCYLKSHPAKKKTAKTDIFRSLNWCIPGRQNTSRPGALTCWDCFKGNTAGKAPFHQINIYFCVSGWCNKLNMILICTVCHLFMLLFHTPTSAFLNCETERSEILENTTSASSPHFVSGPVRFSVTRLSPTIAEKLWWKQQSALLCELYSFTSEQTHTSFIYVVCVSEPVRKKMTHSFFSLPPVSRWAMSQNQVKSGRIINRPAPQKQTRRASSCLWKHTVMEKVFFFFLYSLYRKSLML